jgi:hypothetical protein
MSESIADLKAGIAELESQLAEKRSKSALEPRALKHRVHALITLRARVWQVYSGFRWTEE